MAIRPILRPVTRLVVGYLAIPLFRLFLHRVARVRELSEELEKDLEQWFRASLLLLVATNNMEHIIFSAEWLPDILSADWLPDESKNPILLGFRLLLAMSVIEAMPDQELFAIIHPGPPDLELKNGLRSEIKTKWRDYLRGLVCQHLNRSSPVFAILAAIPLGQPGSEWIGWTCYFVAIAQYLIIGLVTSADKALDVLSEFDRQIKIKRRQLVDEFVLGDLIDDDTAQVNTTAAPIDEKDPPPVANAPPARYLKDAGEDA